MKDKLLSFAVLGLMAAFIIIGCQNPGEKRLEEQRKNLENSKTDNDKYSEEWVNFKKESEIKITTNEEKISLFKVKLKRSSTKIRVKYNKDISYLEQTNIDIKKTLNNYKNDGKILWDDFKASFSIEMYKLEEAVNNLTVDSN